MGLALAIRDLEKDASPMARLQVRCDRCDPDSPRPIPQEKCTKCRGTGYVFALADTIAGDIRRARLALLRGDLESEFDE